jgi:hypothetical protein
MGQVSDYLYCLVIAVTLAAECLVIVWSATSHRPRLWRALVVWAAVALLLPARAYVPALVFTMTAALTWALTYAIDSWPGGSATDVRSRPFAWNYQIADLLVVMLFLGTVIAICRTGPIPGIWSVFLLPLFGLPLAPVLALASRAGTGPYRARMVAATAVAVAIGAAMLVWIEITQQLHLAPLARLRNYGFARREIVATHVALVACLVSCAALVAWLSLTLWSHPPRWKRRGYALALALFAALGILLAARYFDELLLRPAGDIGKELLWLSIHAAPLIVLALLSAATGWLASRDWKGPGSRASRSLRGATLAGGAVLLLPASWLYWQMVRPLPFPPPPAAGENNYERIVAISQELGEKNERGRSGGDPLAIDPLLDEVAILLRANNYVPTSALEEEASRVYPPRIRGQYLHDLAIRLCGAARHKADRGDYDRSADYCLAALRFGEMYHRGGTEGHRRFGFQRELEALALLVQNGGRLSPAKSHEVIDAIGQAMRDREDPAIGEERSYVYFARSGGWSGRLRSVLPKGTLAGEYEQALRDEHLEADAQLIAVQTILAIRAFEKAEERLPATLDELVPRYLLRLPIDFHSSRPLVYRPAATDFELYSVGHDGLDNGGNFDPARYHPEQGFDLDRSWNVALGAR